MREPLVRALFFLFFCVFLSDIVFQQPAFAKVKLTPERIVSLSPATTEWVWALNLGPKLVGRTENCDYPKEAIQVASVGKFLEPNIEAVLALKPDLVLVTDDFNPRRIAELERLQLSVFQLQVGSLDKLFGSLQKLANEMGGRAEAAQIVTSLQSQLQRAQLSNAHRSLDVQSFVGFVDISEKYVFSEHSFLGSLFSAMGLKNIVVTPSAFPQVTPEFLWGKAPDLIFVFDDMQARAGVWPSALPDNVFGPLALSAFESDSLFKSFRVGQKLRTLKLPADVFLRPGPRLQEAISHLSRRLGALRTTGVAEDAKDTKDGKGDSSK